MTKICPQFSLKHTRWTQLKPDLSLNCDSWAINVCSTQRFQKLWTFPSSAAEAGVQIPSHLLAQWQYPSSPAERLWGVIPPTALLIKPGWKTTSFLLLGQRLAASSFCSLAMAVDFSGTWNLISNDNFEGYMVALGRWKYPILSFFPSPISVLLNFKEPEFF